MLLASSESLIAQLSARLDMAAMASNTMSCCLTLGDTSTNLDMKWRLSFTCLIAFKRYQHSLEINLSLFSCDAPAVQKMGPKTLLQMYFQKQSKLTGCSCVPLLLIDARRWRWTNTNTKMTQGLMRPHMWRWWWCLRWWPTCGVVESAWQSVMRFPIGDSIGLLKTSHALWAHSQMIAQVASMAQWAPWWAQGETGIMRKTESAMSAWKLNNEMRTCAMQLFKWHMATVATAVSMPFSWSWSVDLHTGLPFLASWWTWLLLPWAQCRWNKKQT